MTQTISSSLADKGVVLDREIRELLVPYLEAMLPGTEYEGKVNVGTQNSESVGENSIVVGVLNETDAINAYNGIYGYDLMRGETRYRHDRDVAIAIEVNMSDNDALWMLSKYLCMCLIMDMASLSSSGILKIATHPVISNISVKDPGSRKIWTARITIMARIHNQATMTSEIY